MAENKKDAEQEKAAPKAKGKPNLLENKALVLGIIVIVQAVVAIGLTQFVIVPRLGVGAAAAGGEAVADAHGEKPAAEGKHGEEAKGEKKEKKEKKSEKKGGHGGGGEAGAEGEGGNLADLQEIIVTLAGDSARPRYLRIAVNLEMADPEFVPLVVGRRPQLRDAVIMTLSDKTPAMLSTPDGKKRLREEIFRRASEQLPEGALLNVYFSDLVVQ
ncbi:MAG: flagellar basal body-associated FliL family protein [bacterium]|nr:flagellar basal body-associated FliL family protein [bacterium]